LDVSRDCAPPDRFLGQMLSTMGRLLIRAKRDPMVLGRIE